VKQSAVCKGLVKPLVGSMLKAKATSTRPAASKNNQAIFAGFSFSLIEGSRVVIRFLS
jgi:hypothetical protein